MLRVLNYSQVINLPGFLQFFYTVPIFIFYAGMIKADKFKCWAINKAQAKLHL
jgi:hypothetical protein